MPHFVKERAAQRIKEIEAAVYRERSNIGLLQFAGADGANEVVGPGFRWTGAESASWLRGQFTVPADWAGERVALWVDISGCEPLLFLNENAVQALDYNHQDVLIADPAHGGETLDLAIECYAPSRGGSFEIRAADVVLVDRAAYALFYDFTVATQLLGVLSDDTRAGQALQIALDAAMNQLDYTEGPRGTAFYASLPAARAALQTHFFDVFHADNDRDPAVICAGHSHLDLAYLWTLANTRKKVGRTFSTVLQLMDEFPDYHFTQSQPQLYAYAKELYPEVYARMKARIAEGRWEPTGGMWVEADCNVTSGESLIRQILVGNRFFEREFGLTTRVLWLPDVFGYSAALPQIIKGCGMEYFLTTKISWSQFNRMPCDTFFWRGLDGTEVLTHFVTAPDWHGGLQQKLYTYNGKMTAGEAKGLWDEYQQKGVNHELLDLFGHGDGGGGPTRLMLETARRLGDIPGVPRCKFGKAEPFFDRLHDRVKNNPHTPRWVGELYLENHRGTYTAQGRIKRANRQAEILYRGAELFGSMALALAGAAYPQADLARGWESLLLNQFHDILPGTCIAPAVADAMRDYETVHAIGQIALDTALDTLAENVRTTDHSIIVFNPTDTLRPADAVAVSLPSSLFVGKRVEFADENGAPLPSQKMTNGAGGTTEYLVTLPDVGALGWQTLAVGRAGGPPEAANLTATPTLLENDFVRVRFDEHGEIVSLVHKLYDDEDDEASIREREVIAPGQTANALVLFEDKPYAYDGWNVDIFYEDKPYPLCDIGTVESVTVIETGPVRAGIEITRTFLQSSLTQRVYLYAHGPRVVFETEVDWQERQMLLKVAFPVAVQASRATYEIPFGCLERPTHRNTSWDVARFEVCGQKWADLSEGDYGVSLLSDCKYGYDIHDNVMRLTLLKAGTHPDPQADRGANTFTYALLPHTGDWRAETVDEAYAFHYPLLSRYVPANRAGSLPLTCEFATVNDQGIVIETIKKAEDSDDLVIRLYEAFNTRGTATLTLGFPVAEAWETNLVEKNLVPVSHDGESISFAFRPFEIKTFVVRPEK